MRIACSIPKAKDPQSVCVTLITFPHDLWLRERALVFPLYVHCLSRDIKTGHISAEFLSESNIQYIVIQTTRIHRFQ